MKRIAFLVQLPKNVSPGQRFRIEQYEPLLKNSGFRLDTFSYLGKRTYTILYEPGHSLQKASGVLWGFCKRWFFLVKLSRYDYIFLQREASPLGPPIFEWMMARLFRKKLIMDFDDAIWIADGSDSSDLLRITKCFWKIKYICRWSYKISVGNTYLAEYAKRYGKDVMVIPTCVDTCNRYNRTKNQTTDRPVIGWTGSHSTIKYLDILYPVLQKLETVHDFEFLVICNRPPDFKLKSMRFLPWNEQTEIDDLLKINIGVMPLIEDLWSEGKCGFKIIQYLALGIPAVASPVGVNGQIIEPGVNGFLCVSEEEWYHALVTLITQEQTRKRMGIAGREKIVAQYSLQANADAFLGLFK